MHVRHLTVMAFAIALLSPAAAIVETENAQHVGHAKQSSSAPLLQAVRDATERFNDVSVALAEGYAKFQGCVSGPEQGAMGVHYSNFALFDDLIDVAKPEALVYEPQNGRLQLVAAEYITPADAWNATHDDFDRPEVMGQLFHFAPGPNRYGPVAFYELHVWAWKDNPNGAFADWNPRVTCEEWSPGREF